MRFLIFVFVMAFALLASFYAQAYSANDSAKTISTDGSYADTTNALDYVTRKTEDGWVMTVGTAGGTYTWSTNLSFSIPQRFTLQGASSNNPPVITFGSSFSGSDGISFIGTANKIVTIKDLILQDVSGGPSGTFIRIYSGVGVCFRFSNIVFTNKVAANNWIIFGYPNATVTPGPYGLVDNCKFLTSGSSAYGIFIYDNGSASSNSWHTAMSWGTTNSVVIEDCVWSAATTGVGQPAIDGCAGGRVTFRNNTCTNYTLACHGRQCGGGSSMLQMEIYNNLLHFNVMSGNQVPWAHWLRGGTQVVWSNTVSLGSGIFLSTVWRLSEECASADWAAELCPAQLVYPADYPASQQAGHGVVAGEDGLVPIYIWNNTVPSTDFGEIKPAIDGGDAPFIVLNREYYTSAMPGYSSLTYPHPLRSDVTPSRQNLVRTIRRRGGLY